MKNNIHETSDKNDCTRCQYFYSYQSMFEDELEPCEYGVCEHELNKESDATFGEGSVCDLWKNRYKV
jgi:hypothetical protein